MEQVLEQIADKLGRPSPVFLPEPPTYVPKKGKVELAQLVLVVEKKMAEVEVYLADRSV